MDEAIRALARAATTHGPDGGDEEAQAELDRACDRAGLELPREVVARLPRWRTLRWLVDGWFRRSLEAGPGGDPAALAAAGSDLACALPRALREAWRLVGDRPELQLRAPGAWRLTPYPVHPVGWHLVVADDLDAPHADLPLGPRRDELHLPDPPVVEPLPPDPTDDDPRPRAIEAWPSVSALVVSRALRVVWHELPRLRAPEDLFGDDVRRAFVHGPGLAALRTALQGRAVSCPRGTSFPLELHSDGDTLLLVDGGRGLASARTPAAWAAVLERVNRFAPS